MNPEDQNGLFAGCGVAINRDVTFYLWRIAGEEKKRE
jgi:hypothetical protein